jgi:hypothetical protein
MTESPNEKSLNEIPNEVRSTLSVPNVFSDATGWVESYNQAFENLLQEFRNKAVHDTSLVVHCIWKEVNHLGALLCIFSVTPT